MSTNQWFYSAALSTLLGAAIIIPVKAGEPGTEARPAPLTCTAHAHAKPDSQSSATSAAPAVPASRSVGGKKKLRNARTAAKPGSGVRLAAVRLVQTPEEAKPAQAPAAAVQDEDLLSDALIEAQIKNELYAQIGKSSYALEVESAAGVVNLSGELPDRAHRDRAMRIARQFPGVLAVHDQMQITSFDTDTK